MSACFNNCTNQTVKSSFSSVKKKTVHGHQPQFLNRMYAPDVAISELL